MRIITIGILRITSLSKVILIALTLYPKRRIHAPYHAYALLLYNSYENSIRNPVEGYRYAAARA
jgi:hypothetical protein